MTSSNSFVTDFIGNIFQVKSYNRIISLVPSLTDLLFSFGLGNRIVGVTKYCTYPVNARDKPRTIVGGTKNPDIKTIVNLNPDIILINQEENQLKHYHLLKEYGLPVFVTFPKTVSEAVSLFYEFKKLFSIGRLKEFDELERVLEKTSQRVAELLIRKKVFCPIWKNPWMSINSDTFASSIIEFCGGKNLTANYSERYPKISLETIMKEHPDIILLPDEPYRFEEADKMDLLDLFDSNKPIIKILDGTFHWYSFIMIESIKTLSRIILQE